MKTLAKFTDYFMACAFAGAVWLFLMFFLGAGWTGGLIAFQIGGAVFRYLLSQLLNLN